MIVGDVWLGKIYKLPTVNILHIYISDGGRPALYEPYPSTFQIKESYGVTDWNSKTYCYEVEDHLERSMFQQIKEDEQETLSIEDINFLNIMELCKENENNIWGASLPFKSPRRLLSHNRVLAER